MTREEPARPIADLLDFIAAPAALLMVFGALLVLVWVGYSVNLDRDLARLPEPVRAGRVSEAVGLALQVFEADRTTDRRMAATVAAAAVGQVRGVDTTLRQAAYSLLLQVGGRRATLGGRFLSVAHFGTVPGKSARGLEQAARMTFGVGADSLSLGEALVLADRALYAPTGSLPSGREDMLRNRSRLLGRALELGVIDLPRYESELALPLSLARDDRPVW